MFFLRDITPIAVTPRMIVKLDKIKIMTDRMRFVRLVFVSEAHRNRPINKMSYVKQFARHILATPQKPEQFLLNIIERKELSAQDQK